MSPSNFSFRLTKPKCIFVSNASKFIMVSCCLCWFFLNKCPRAFDRISRPSKRVGFAFPIRICYNE